MCILSHCQDIRLDVQTAIILCAPPLQTHPHHWKWLGNEKRKEKRNSPHMEVWLFLFQYQFCFSTLESSPHCLDTDSKRGNLTYPSARALVIEGYYTVTAAIRYIMESLQLNTYHATGNSAANKLMVFYYFFLENIGDNLHEMSNPVFWIKIKKNINLLSAGLAQGVVMVKCTIFTANIQPEQTIQTMCQGLHCLQFYHNILVTNGLVQIFG